MIRHSSLAPKKKQPTSPSALQLSEKNILNNKSYFGRAVECAENFGLCDVDEMTNLADQLMSFEGCIFEEGVEMCEKEEQDRRDVAETLQLGVELQLRMDYLKNANLFADDVKIEREQVLG